MCDHLSIKCVDTFQKKMSCSSCIMWGISSFRVVFEPCEGVVRNGLYYINKTVAWWYHKLCFPFYILREQVCDDKV